jgi:hypothetical protein
VVLRIFFFKQPNFIDKVALSIRHTQRIQTGSKTSRNKQKGNKEKGKEPHRSRTTASPNTQTRRSKNKKHTHETTSWNPQQQKQSTPQAITQMPLPFVE